ncbi:FecR family protein [Chitinophaga vietnamensis]|uniref:FecR family protein n=1 Tax=Chitinophaga vietnamensis TaxID=2593957 RepID=UPI001375685F|nr:FecR domain-containing protein [Chitinophaga vietnamensis]
MDNQTQKITNILAGLRAQETALSADEIEAVKRQIDGRLRGKLIQLWVRRAAIAASVLLVLAATFYLLATRSTTIVNGYASTKIVRLPDGSIVTLNANSTLRYSSWWLSWKERAVWLDGEAFFKVTKKPAGFHPKFVVHTGGLDVKVMGTAFNVYNRRKHIEVRLEEGKVTAAATGWADGGGSYRLLPGEAVQLDVTDKRLKALHLAGVITPKNGRLVFNNIPLQQVAQVIADNYGYQVRWKNTALQQERFTGSVPADKLPMLLAAIRAVFDKGTVVQEGQTITFQ